MNTQIQSLFSRTSTKVVLAVAIAAGMIAILSGVLVNLDGEIAVQSRTSGLNARPNFASLPEYGYIQAHQARNVQPVKVIAATGFQALPEYGYIRAHSVVTSQETYLPAGMRNLAEFGYIQSHNRFDTSTGMVALAPIIPEGLRALPAFGYIEAHSRPGADTFVAGLPRGLNNLTEAGYIRMHSTRAK
jgi:hypothetical protein